VSFFGSLVRRSIESPAVPLTSTALLEYLDLPGNLAGVTVSPKTVLGIPAVWRSVRLRSGSGAALPLHTFRMGTRERVVARLIERPHPDMTEFEHREWCWQSLDLWGNVYCLKVRNEMGVITALLPLSPSSVKVGRVYADRDTPTGKVFEVTDDQGRRWPLTSYEVWHVPGFSTDGVIGLSPVSILRQSLGLALAADQHGAEFYAKGNMLSGILSTDARIDPDTAEKVKARWKSLVAGKAHEVAVLGAGLKFQPVQMPNTDAQFLESRKFQVTEIARAFGIPPYMLYDVEKSTSWGTGIEQQGIGFVVYTMQPDLVRFEQRYTAEIAPARAYAKHMVQGLMRGDSAQRAAFYRTMREIGAMNVDTIRDLEDMPPLPDGLGQSYVQPLNMGELGEGAPTDELSEAT
jgi:HK97 family phage portal protein